MQLTDNFTICMYKNTLVALSVWLASKSNEP